MRIYSDTLTREHLFDAARSARVGLDELIRIKHARVRASGWVVRLEGSSTRHRNSGTMGADTGASRPATWDEHGRWMAYLFAIDPHARIAYYDGAKEFNQMTRGAYARVPA